MIEISGNFGKIHGKILGKFLEQNILECSWKIPEISCNLMENSRIFFSKSYKISKISNSEKFLEKILEKFQFIRKKKAFLHNFLPPFIKSKRILISISFIPKQ